MQTSVPRNRPRLGFVVGLCLGVAACGSQSSGNDDGPGNTDGEGGPAEGQFDPAERTSFETELTICSETADAYEGESMPECEGDAPASTCPPQVMGTAEPPQRCGAMTGCTLDRNQAIDAIVETTYTAGPDDYTPPEPPHDSGADPVSPMGTWMHAEATAWFARPDSGDGYTIQNTDQPGSCGIYSRDLMILAIPTPQFGQNDDPGPDVWNLAYWCGACAEIVGPSGKRVRVQVVTQRAYDGDGNHYSIDLPGNAYGDSRVDTPYSLIDTGETCSIGMPVDWRIVPCEVCGGIVLTYTPGFNTYTPAFRITNHRLPIVDAYYRNESGDWARLQRDSVNQYHTGPADPMQVRIVAIDGATIEGSFPAYQEGRSFEAQSQF